jgi:predicted permease
MIWLLELKQSAQRLLKSPGSSALAIMVITTGIALALCIYTFTYVQIYRPIPVSGGDQLFVAIVEESYDKPALFRKINVSMINALKEQQLSSSHLVPAKIMNWLNYSNGKNAARPHTMITSPQMFSMINATPLLGRTLVAADAETDAPDVAVISHELWQTVHQGDPGILGQDVVIHGNTHQVVGVMPESFVFPVTHKLWLPLKVTQDNLNEPLFLLGRLAPGVELSDAEAELDQFYQTYEHNKQAASGQQETVGHVRLLPLQQMFSVNPNQIPRLLFTIAVVLLLLVSCNIAILLLAHNSENARELAVKKALGAPTSRLLWQVMSEALILCLCGSVLGILLAGWLLDLSQPMIRTWLDFGVPFWWNYELEAHSVLMVAVATLAVWLVTSALPAWHCVRSPAAPILNDGNRGAVGRSSGRLGGLLLIAQIALSASMLVLSLLSALFLWMQYTLDKGIDPKEFATGHILLAPSDYPGREDRVAYSQALESAVNSIPGIVSTGVTNALPARRGPMHDVVIEGLALEDDNPFRKQGVISVSNNYFDALNLKPIVGRNFNSLDTADSAPVVIIDELMAKALWPDESPLGKRLQTVSEESPDKQVVPWLTVVGVIPHFLQGDPIPQYADQTSIFRPISQSLPFEGAFAGLLRVIARTQGDPKAYMDDIEAAARKVDPSISIDALRTLQERFNFDTAISRFLNGAFTVFAAMSTLLVFFSTFSLTSRDTYLRTQEIALRRALGGTSSRIMLSFLQRNTKRLLWGLLLGAPMTVILYLLFSDMLGDQLLRFFGLYTVAVLIIAIVSSIASIIPLYQATRGEPASRLHHQ